MEKKKRELWINEPQNLLKGRIIPDKKILRNKSEMINYILKWCIIIFIISISFEIEIIKSITFIILVMIIIISVIYNISEDKLDKMDKFEETKNNKKGERCYNKYYNKIESLRCNNINEAEIREEKDYEKEKKIIRLNNPKYYDFGKENDIHNLSEKNNNLTDIINNYDEKIGDYKTNEDRIYNTISNSSYIVGNRSFYNLPNTKIPNDQKAYMNWLYRNYGSCKSDMRKCDIFYDNLKYKKSLL